VADYTSHAPGTFCWPELSTSDQKAAVAFYRSLFGWEVHEQPTGPGETYSMFQIRGKEVAAAAGQRPDERQHGIPPHWNSYVSVASADETVTRAQSLGGRVLAPAFDVMDVGRMAVLQDPTGATFQIWEPRKHIGVKILGEPGALTWTELATSDTERAKTFYTSLFGWKEKTSSGDGMTYTEFSVGDRPGAGMMAMTDQMKNMHVPPNWMPYFQVADVDGSADRAKTLGAMLYVPPTDIPNVGRFSVVRDPQGAVFAIFRPLPRSA
jgi:predicted enzyme related to lactoylglutathione lyase